MVAVDRTIFIQQDNILRRSGDEFNTASASASGSVIMINGAKAIAMIIEPNPIQAMGDTIEIEPKDMIVSRLYEFIWNGVQVFARKSPDGTIDFYALRNC